MVLKVDETSARYWNGESAPHRGKCKPKRLENRWAVPISCATKLDLIPVFNNSGKPFSAIRFDVFQETPSASLKLWVARYSSRIRGNTNTLKFFTSAALKGNKWQSARLDLPALIFGNSQVRLRWEQSNQTAHFIRNNYWYQGSLRDPQFAKLLQDSKLLASSILDTEGLWISMVELIHEEVQSEEVAAVLALQEYRSLLDSKLTRFSLAGLFLFQMSLLIFRFRTSFRYQLLLATISPFTLAIALVLYYGIPLSKRLLDSKVRQLIAQIKQEKTLFKQSLNSGHNELRISLSNHIHKMQPVLESKVSSGAGEVFLSRIHAQQKQLNRSTLVKKCELVLKLRKDWKARLVQVSEEVSPQHLDLVINRFIKQCNDPSPPHYSGAAYFTKNPVALLLQEIFLDKGIYVTLTDFIVGLMPFDANTDSQSLNMIEILLMKQMMKEQSSSYQDRVLTDPDSGQVLQDIREKLVDAGMNPGYLDQVLNRPDLLHFSTIARDTNQPKGFFWQPISVNNKPWLVFGEVDQRNQISAALPHFSGTPGSGNDKKVYFVGESHQLNIPLGIKNSAVLNLASKVARESQPSLASEMIDGKLHLLFGFRDVSLPNYQIIVTRDISSALSDVQNLRLLLESGFLLLIFLPVLAAFTLSQQVSSPIQKLTNGALELANGNYHFDLQSDSRDEFQSITNQMNEMLVELRMGQEISSFLDKASLDEILQDMPGTGRLKASILFCGIHNLEEIANLELEDYKEQVEHFVSLVQDAIQQNGGMVDKFTGTAVLAVFIEGSISLCAASAATQIQKQIQANEVLHPKLRMGTGISTGTLIYGEIGANERKDFTCIGDTVNLAARLESYSKKEERRILTLVDTATKQDIEDQLPTGISIREYGDLEIKGKASKQKAFLLEAER